MKGFEGHPESVGMEHGDTAVEGKRLSPAKRALIKSLMVLGMAGFMANGPKAEAQDAGMHPGVEQKEVMKQDYFRMNQLAKDYATMLFHANIDPRERQHRYEKLSDEYGAGAIDFIQKRFGEKEQTQDLPAGSDDQKGTLANFLDEEALINDVVFDPNLPKAFEANKKGGYITKEIVLGDGEKANVLVEYEYALPNDGDVAETMLQEHEAIWKSISQDPSLAKFEPYERGFEIKFKLLIKGGPDHPGWYEITGITDKERDQRAPIY